MATSTPGRGLPVTALTDVPDENVSEGNLATALDRVLSGDAGTLASRPTAVTAVGTSIGSPFTFWWATDTLQLSMSFGGAWIDLGGASGPPVPIGGSIEYAGNGDPVDVRWLLEDGRALARTGQYAPLFAAISTTYGAGDGSTTFNIPDSRGRVTVGPDNMGTTAGAAGRLPNSLSGRGNVGGEERHTLLAAESGVNGSGSSGAAGAHGHTITVGTQADSINGWNVPIADGSWSKVDQNFAVNSTFRAVFPGALPAANVSYYGINHGHPASASAVGDHVHALSARNADSAHNNIQPYVVKNKIIRVR